MSGIAKSATIHPMAIVEDGAVLGEGVSIGPFCFVGHKVVLGDNVQLLNNAVVTGRTTLGKAAKFFPWRSSAVIRRVSITAARTPA